MKGLNTLICFLLLISSHQISAVDINIKISGNVLIPPCDVNYGKSVEISFDNIYSDYDNSKPVSKSVTLPVSCGYYTGTPYVKMEGPVLAGASNTVLQLNPGGGGSSALGVEFYQGSAIIEKNKISLAGVGWNKLISGLGNINSGDSTFEMTAVIFRVINKELLTDSYSGTATMTISYL